MTKYLVSFFALGLLLGHIAAAQVRQWKDESGVIHLENVPSNKSREKETSQKEPEPEPVQAGNLEEAEAAYKAGDYTKAFRLLKPLAKRGVARAQNGLGFLYGRGLGVKKDLRQAFKWHRKAAEQGYALAQYYVGLMYADGEGVFREPTEGARWLRKAALQGLPQAQFNLGAMYAAGEGVVKDRTEAAKWYRKAAEQGHAEAQFNLGYMYATGDGVFKDQAKAMKWFLAKKPRLHFDNRKWRIGHRDSKGAVSLVEYVLEGETVENWSELVTWQYFLGWQKRATPEKIVEGLRKIRTQNSPGVVWNVISKGDKDSTYEWKIENDRRFEDQHEIGRIIKGKYGVHMIRYTMKKPNIPPRKRQEWINLLNSARTDD